MTDFKSELENILPCKELLFDATPGFGRYAPYLGHAVAHPAKMNTRLTEYLILQLTKPGEIVLDPMSGSGQTGIIASLNGRDAVCVELEQKFHDWQLAAKKQIEVAQTFTVKGNLHCVLGDARKLGELLTAADAIVTSPPYADPNSRERKPDAVRNVRGRGNIGAPYDAIVSSPPYSGSVTGNLPKTEERSQRMIEAGYDPKTVLGGKARNAQVDWHYAPRIKKDNIGNLSHGDIDAVITSPPYEDSVSDDKEGPLAGANQERYGRWKEGTATKNSYTQHEAPCKVDAVITSPPYSEGIGHGHAGENASHEYEARLQMQERYASAFESEGNIGNMKKETYLQAMLTVYGEMFDVLKPGGTAVIVVKAFIRNKQVVDLPYQTWLLMQKCGFELTQLYKLRLEQQSFWRILYVKKHPEVAQIWHEHILVCKKPLQEICEMPSVLACNPQRSDQK